MIKQYLRRFFTPRQLEAYGWFKLYVRLFFGGVYFDLFQRKYRVEGLEFNIPYHLTQLMFRGRFPLDMYEKEERRYLKDHLDKNATVLELGACLGVVSCLTNRLLAHPERHVVVEPHPELVQYVQRNRDQNHCQFQVENCIVSEQPKNTFYVADLITAGSIHRPTGRTIQVKGRTIAELEAAHRLQFDTLVMDIEGGELAFFRNHRDLLPKFRQIFVEMHPFDNILTDAEAAECAQILREAGFHQVLEDHFFEIWKQ